MGELSIWQAGQGCSPFLLIHGTSKGAFSKYAVNEKELLAKKRINNSLHQYLLGGKNELESHPKQWILEPF